MSGWSIHELTAIGTAEKLQLSSRRSDGSLRRPVAVWVVRHGDELYVRSLHGREGAWFRGTQTRHEGHISAGGVERDVEFADADHSLDDEIDGVYLAKYHRYGPNLLAGVVNPAARAATIRLVPR
ncbi:DUF2255 family protein [Nonomuraea maheshkhaliensis]|uniref:DUF2255 family protein n=1 Tax=Nonomuraea maheshkhaliensis TaxID=419590 RepID=A0ABN2EW63_9ACTN